METKHTPSRRPWRAKKFDDTKSTTIYAEGGTASLGSFKRAEDADMAVRAVNSHEALIRRIEILGRALEKATGWTCEEIAAMMAQADGKAVRS